ncbi:MAG: ATP-binding cassette domain-containing protein [Firmicutes bacterium]|nr:ATP-binding cassette domain-containing protein [Bacillota bacterium]
MISVKNIDKYFNKNSRSEVHVLKDITTSFPNEGLVVLQGNSGSGKTTFLNVIGGLDTIDKGEIQFEEYGSKKFSQAVWNKIRTEDIGYIFQNYYLLPNISVFDNVAVSLKLIGIIDPQEIEKRVNYMLKTVGMYNFRKRKATQLSGGQKQRVAIARALVKNPRVVIADEPTGNLDSRNTVEIMNIIKKISLHRLVILVTHEKEIANFYGDHIITIKDGEIVSDIKNTPIETYDVEDHDIFYLKDFKHIQEAENITYYQDKDNVDLPNDVKISLIYRNDTLFLDVQGAIKKVKLVTKESGIQIKDESYKTQLKDDFLKTEFDLSILDHKSLAKRKGRVFSFTDSVKDSFLRIMRLSKVGKVMLAGFVIAGMITAVSVSVLGNTLYNKEVFVSQDVNYITFYKSRMNMTYEEIAQFKGDDETFFINPYTKTTMKISIPTSRSTRTTYDLNGSFDLLDHISESDIVFGRMPENKYEIVVDQKVYSNTNGLYSALTRYGVWHSSQLINEEVIVLDEVFTIVGISNSGLQKIYGDRSVLNLLSYSNRSYSSKFLSYELISDQVVVVNGRMPDEGEKELLVPNSWFGIIIPTYAFFNGGSYSYTGLKITGTYDESLIGFNNIPYIGHDVDIEYYLIKSFVGTLDIYTQNPRELVNEYLNAGYTANWPYDTSLIVAETSVQRLAPILYISVAIVLFSGLGIYYMMRSSMLSRIYSISVYRALGVKQSSIRNTFIIEIIMLTTISSLIGFLFGAYVIMSIQDKSTLQHLFYLNYRSILIGIVIIYLSNLFFGLLSIRSQIKKTPSQLLSQYDM